MIYFKKISQDCILPKYAHKEDAGMDIYSNESVIIKKNSWQLIKTGFAMELPKGYEAQVRSKSGIALNSGVFVLNSPGTIDSNYRGEVCIILMNLSKQDYTVKKHQKIAQMVISKVEYLDSCVVKELSKTDRNNGGFGSTGLK